MRPEVTYLAIMNPHSQIIVRADAHLWGTPGYRLQIIEFVKQGVAGVAFFSGSLEQVVHAVEDCKAYAGAELFIAADFEHGMGMRVSDAVSLPRAMALGRSPENVTAECARMSACAMSQAGFNLNFAPVADVHCNSKNPVIGTRSFHSDPNIAAAHVSAYVHAMQEVGVISCVKHFPGHGATFSDSHIESTILDVDIQTLQKRELIPFKAAIDVNVKAVMVGHITVPVLDNQPASLSRAVINDLLKGQLGFQGVVITDAMDMRAVTNQYNPGQAAVMALKSGCDLILMPADLMQAVHAIEFELSSVSFHERYLSAQRATNSLLRWQRKQAASSRNEYDVSEHALTALNAARMAIEIVGSPEVLPLTHYKHLAAFAIVEDDDQPIATEWLHYLASATEMNCDYGFINLNISDADIKALSDGVAQAEVIVFLIPGSPVAYRGSVTDCNRVATIIKQLAKERPVVTVTCGANRQTEVESVSAVVLYTWSETQPSLAASVFCLTGKL